MKFIDVLKRQLEEKIAERNAAQVALDAALEAPAAEARDLTTEEKAEFEARKSTLITLKGEVADLEARVAELAELDAREERAAEVKPAYDGVARVGSEARTYNPDAERSGANFLRDVANQGVDPQAAQRLQRHMHEEGVERRDVGTGAFAGLTVPQYLTDLVAPTRRAGRPVADIATKRALPDAGMVVTISRVTTASATAIQASENAAVQETDMDDTALNIDVRTIAGAQDVSRQALDRSTGVQDVVLADLVSAYNTNLDSQIINGAGTSGTHLGIRSVSGIVSVAYTDASPTAGELYPKLADLIQQAEVGAFAGLTHFVMHPRRWWWIAKELGSTFPLVQFPNTSAQVAGNAGGASYGDSGRNIFGVPVVLDANIPTNLGAGTNEDVILGVNADELHLWEDSNAPLFIRAEQTGAGNLTVKLVVYGYSAFTAGRYPATHGTIGGTGLVTPTF